MVWCSLRAACKYPMVSYEQETNTIYETSIYCQDISVILYTVLNKKNSFKIKVFPENGGVLNIKPRFH